MARKINIGEGESLRSGAEKINEAMEEVNSFQNQIDTIVVEGDSSVEAAQARVDADGQTYTTLKERLDTEYTKTHQKIDDNHDDVTAQLAQTNQEIGNKSDLPKWLQESLREIVHNHDNHLKEIGINVKQPPYNAPADGFSHPLSERFDTLEEAQSIFTAATSLDDQIDWASIQSAIDYANNEEIGIVFIPASFYVTNKPITLNGCTVIGVPSNIFSEKGTVISAETKDFTAVAQGSLSSQDNMFNIKNILVKNADIAFEINYAINSIFEQLYAVDCNTGFKLGDTTSVGSMFCIFNNLYTRRCNIGVYSHSSQYFNNNVFNNGFIQGDEKAFHLEVSGGSGAINNVFNNVEFRSKQGRGLVLRSVENLTLNNPYFECGANAVRMLNYCSFTINEGVYAMFESDNSFNDNSFIFAEGGANLKFNGGLMFLSSENDNTFFYNATNPATHGNIYLMRNLRSYGSAENFIRFQEPINRIGYQMEVVQ